MHFDQFGFCRRARRVQFLQFVTRGLIRFISRCTAERNESSLRREAHYGSKKKIKESGARVCEWGPVGAPKWDF